MEALKILAAFAAGIGCGVLITKSYFDRYYRDIADEEIDSVIENFKIHKADDFDTDDEEKKVDEKTAYHKETESYISSVPPTTLVDDEVDESPEDDDPDREAYQITSMEFLNDDGYFDKVSLIYYVEDDALVDEDGILADEDDTLVDIDQTVGRDNIDILKNGFDDGSAMYVRNTKIGVDYELTKSYASYSEMIGSDDD